MPYDFVLVDVFTDRPFGGNQLAVVTHADGLSRDLMQSIAREFNFAETTFVLPPERPRSTARLRIFSPKVEMPFAGHPTVGSAAALARLGLVPSELGLAQVAFDENVGTVHVMVRDIDGRLHSELRLEGELEQESGCPNPATLVAILSLPAASVRQAWFAGVGVPFAFCHLTSATEVDAAVLDKAVWTAALDKAWARNVYLFSGELEDGANLYARMFAPELGIDEDPATGSASAALAACVAERDGRMDAQIRLTIRQGVKMNRPSVITAGARVEGGRLRNVTVGGEVVVVGTGVLDPISPLLSRRK